MTGDVEEEVGDNDENALDWGDGAAWWDSYCANAVSRDFVKEASQWGFICESSEITSAGTPGKVGDFRIREEQRELQEPKSKSGGTEHRDRDVPHDKVHAVGVSRGWLEGVGATGYYFGGRSASDTGVWCIYASPSKVYSVWGHEGPMVPLTIWPIRDQQSGFDDGWKAWHKTD
jgi:hypothetical protein